MFPNTLGRTQGMCERIVEKAHGHWCVCVLDQYKTQEMCDKVVEK